MKQRKWINRKYEKCGGDWEWCVWRRISWWLSSLFFSPPTPCRTCIIQGNSWPKRGEENTKARRKFSVVWFGEEYPGICILYLALHYACCSCAFTSYDQSRRSLPLDLFWAFLVPSRRSPFYLELRAVSSSLHVSSSFCTEHKAVGQDIYKRLLPVSSRFHSNHRYVNIHPLVLSLLHSNVVVTWSWFPE